MTREERKQAVIQEVYEKGTKDRCHETHISSILFEMILKEYGITLDTLRKYFRENGSKTRLIDWGDYQVLWVKGKNEGKWGEYVVDGKVIEIL